MREGLDLARGRRDEEPVLNLSQALVRACKVARAPHVDGDAVGHARPSFTEM
jgi:hypothetical protein